MEKDVIQNNPLEDDAEGRGDWTVTVSIVIPFVTPEDDDAEI
ncbi:hypothetical protein [Streptomyces sp. NBC_01803]|nr:hypothetical protein [Streptomyces sp. NBC_01803]WSA43108.1 hypothetical protein OIE51_02200 [Streptomyces sp. NBC_01803]